MTAPFCLPVRQKVMLCGNYVLTRRTMLCLGETFEFLGLKIAVWYSLMNDNMIGFAFHP